MVIRRFIFVAGATAAATLSLGQTIIFTPVPATTIAPLTAPSSQPATPGAAVENTDTLGGRTVRPGFGPHGGRLIIGGIRDLSGGRDTTGGRDASGVSPELPLAAGAGFSDPGSARFNPYVELSNIENLKSFIHATDEEWKVICPKIKRLTIARRDMETSLSFGDPVETLAERTPRTASTGDTFAGPGGAGAGAFGSRSGFVPIDTPIPKAATRPATTKAGPALSPAGFITPPGGGPFGQTGAVATAISDLQTALTDADTAMDDLKEKIAAVRSARQKAQVEFKSAQDDLLLLLTTDQEAVLVGLGYLD